MARRHKDDVCSVCKNHSPRQPEATEAQPVLPAVGGVDATMMNKYAAEKWERKRSGVVCAL